MTPRPTSKHRVPFSFLLIAAAACSSDVVGPERHTDDPTIGREMPAGIDPAGYMLDAGCSLATRRAKSGGVVVPLPSGERARFDCSSVDERLVESAVKAYRAALTASLGNAAQMTGYYSYSYDSSQYACGTGSVTISGSGHGWIDVYNSSGDYIGGFTANGAFTFTYSGPVDCRWIDTYVGTWHEWGAPGEDPPPTGGGGGGGGSPQPPAPPPPTDTCATADALGPLRSRGIQDSLNAILAQSRAAGVEMGGYIYRTTVGGPYLIARLIPEYEDACEFRVTGGGPALGQIVAYFHTHPTRDGSSVYCARQGNTITANSVLGGGGSSVDWEQVNLMGKPWYTIDPDRIYRLDPGVPIGDRGLNGNRWDRVQNGCALN